MRIQHVYKFSCPWMILNGFNTLLTPFLPYAILRFPEPEPTVVTWMKINPHCLQQKDRPRSALHMPTTRTAACKQQHQISKTSKHQNVCWNEIVNDLQYKIAAFENRIKVSVVHVFSPQAHVHVDLWQNGWVGRTVTLHIPCPLQNNIIDMCKCVNRANVWTATKHYLTKSGYRSCVTVQQQTCYTYCLPILLYGCQIWHAFSTDKHNVNVAGNNWFIKILVLVGVTTVTYLTAVPLVCLLHYSQTRGKR